MEQPLPDFLSVATATFARYFPKESNMGIVFKNGTIVRTDCTQHKALTVEGFQDPKAFNRYSEIVESYNGALPPIMLDSLSENWRQTQLLPEAEMCRQAYGCLLESGQLKKMPCFLPVKWHVWYGMFSTNACCGVLFQSPKITQLWETVLEQHWKDLLNPVPIALIQGTGEVKEFIV